MKAHFLEIREEAQQELQDGFDWYEIQQIDLGRRFILKVREYINTLKLFPEQYQMIYKKKRAVFIKEFPFQIIYSIIGNTVVVFSVFHTKRNPKIWKKRK
ncbi:MAG: type II toxin-antitoxin system RelE/ParE family toxin [Cytophagales bacterium]